METAILVFLLYVFISLVLLAGLVGLGAVFALIKQLAKQLKW